MAPKKPQAAPQEGKQERPTTTISHCNFTNENSANEHTRAAVVELAKALQANASAISDVAHALRGGGGNTVEAFVRIEQARDNG